MKITLQLQFIIPKFFGSMLVNLPFDIYQASKKQFTKP